MEPFQVEENVKSVQDLVQSWFMECPVNMSYQKVEMLKATPRLLYEGDSAICFEFPILEFPLAFQINQLMIECNIKILTSENALPAQSETIAPINNVLNSLFSSVSVQLNDTNCTPNASYSSYKAYLTALMTYNEPVNWCKDQGFLIDTSYNVDSDEDKEPSFSDRTNPGQINRAAYFREGCDLTAKYSSEGATFLGLLYTDFSTFNKPLPPRTRFSMTLTRNKPEFFLQGGRDGITYKYVLSDIQVICPVVTLGEQVAKSLLNRWAKEPVPYYYRRYMVVTRTIPKSHQFTTTALFPESINPSRVYLAIVREEDSRGRFTTSPYQFNRQWKVAKSAELLRQEEQNVHRDFYTFFAQEMMKGTPYASIQEKWLTLNNRNQSSRVMTALLNPEPGPSRRTRSSGIQNDLDSISSRSTNEPPAPVAPDPDPEPVIDDPDDSRLYGVKKDLWLTKCDLLINTKDVGN